MALSAWKVSVEWYRYTKGWRGWLLGWLAGKGRPTHVVTRWQDWDGNIDVVLCLGLEDLPIRVVRTSIYRRSHKFIAAMPLSMGFTTIEEPWHIAEHLNMSLVPRTWQAICWFLGLSSREPDSCSKAVRQTAAFVGCRTTALDAQTPWDQLADCPPYLCTQVEHHPA